MGLPSSQNLENLMSDQIKNGLVRFEGWRDESCGRQRLLELVLDVTVGSLRYRDRLLWDANEPQNASGAEDFAQETCADLGLGCAAHALRHSHTRSLAAPVPSLWLASRRALQRSATPSGRLC